MITNRRSRWSGWAQQDSNLRPLGEQRTMYPGCTNPTDLASSSDRMYQNVRGCTGLSDEKVTADLGRRITDLVVLAVLFPPLYAAAWWMDRSDKRQGHGRWTR